MPTDREKLVEEALPVYWQAVEDGLPDRETVGEIIAVAEAVIRADLLRELRDPSYEMIEAGRDVYSIADETLSPSDFVKKWQAALDVYIAAIRAREGSDGE